MTENLILPTAGYHKNYPIEPSLRQDAGGFMGTQEKMLDGWLLSSDVGCDFIFMDGVIQTYSILKSPELEAICYEMADRFLEADLYKIKAQTHATLTALRGLLRLYEINGKEYLLQGAIDRYELYKKEGMTENYENFNWFQRPEWTEPCAVVDSYQLALDLWKHTDETIYLEDAQLIWYNAISYAQRDNGGFGLSNCTGPDQRLQTNAYEAHWCCTMRGSEGIAERVRSLYLMKHNNEVVIPDLQNSEVEIEYSSGKFVIEQKTNYPFEDKVLFKVKESNLKSEATLKVFLPAWIKKVQLTKSGKLIESSIIDNFLILKDVFKSGDEYILTFEQEIGKVAPHGNNTPKEQFKIQHGPLVLGIENRRENVILAKDFVIEKAQTNEYMIIGTDIKLRPIYHLMDSKVNVKGEFQTQILFTDQYNVEKASLH